MDVVSRLEGKVTLTIVAGTSCGSLGDERNLREFLVASDVVDALREAGHVVHFLLFNDNLDPLSEAQLRVAVEKDAKLIERFLPYCGKPIYAVPDPYGCHESLSRHFEQALLDRLHRLDCHPTLVNTADLYKRGVYSSYVRKTLQCAGEIAAYCAESFAGYQPEKLYYVLCPICGYIDRTSIAVIGNEFVVCTCDRCGHESEIGFHQLQGKLNYKIECAARWKAFDVDAETFGKPYMEPKSGSFHVSLGIANRFFEGREVIPLSYGQVKVSRDISYRLLESLPPELLRAILLERPHADISLTRDRVVLAASRMQSEQGMTYLDVVKQIVPAWLLTPSDLTPKQREWLGAALKFAEHILNKPIDMALPNAEMFDGEGIEILRAAKEVIREAVVLRQTTGDDYESFRRSAKIMISALGALKRSTLHRLRVITRQSQGLPASKFLFHLPIDYLKLLDYMLTLKIEAMQEAPVTAAARMLISDDPVESKTVRALLSD